MRKILLGLAALSAAIGSVTAASNTASTSADHFNQVSKEALPQKRADIVQRSIARRQYSGRKGANVSVPPKQWGMYLQRTGKQVWTKRRSC